MGREFVLFLKVLFFLTELAIYEYIYNALTSDCSSDDQKMRKQRQLFIMKLYNDNLKNNSNEILSIYTLCFLSNSIVRAVLMTIILNTTDKDLGKLSCNSFVK